MYGLIGGGDVWIDQDDDVWIDQNDVWIDQGDVWIDQGNIWIDWGGDVWIDHGGGVWTDWWDVWFDWGGVWIDWSGVFPLLPPGPKVYHPECCLLLFGSLVIPNKSVDLFFKSSLFFSLFFF